jgi:beta-galactosidase
VQAGDPDLSRYKVLLVPPLYSAPNSVVQQLSDYVKNGGQVVMSFKSGLTDEHSTVLSVMAPGPLREACGFHYQEFTNLPQPERLIPDPYRVGEENTGSVWEEFIVPDTAQVVAFFDDPYWHFPAITRNKYGSGMLTYEGTNVSDRLQREIIRDVVQRAGLTNSDENLPEQVRVRHGRNRQGKLLHYYFNYSGQEQSATYAYGNGSDLLTGTAVGRRQTLNLKPWDLAIIREQ